MITKDSIESAYSFFHQKWRIYASSNIPRQRDDIEYAISEYTSAMNPELYMKLADGRDDFLYDHKHFAEDISSAVDKLSKML